MVTKNAQPADNDASGVSEEGRGERAEVLQNVRIPDGLPTAAPGLFGYEQGQHAFQKDLEGEGGAARKRLDVRPILVVGVGGTGALAVQHVKKRLRQLTGGRDAPFVRFVCFDTTIADDHVAKFSEGEFVNIGQLDFSSIVQNIKNYAHLEYWFPRDRLKPMQVGLGAMGIRHIGRLCYFQWRESPEVKDRIMKRIKDLKNPALKDRLDDLTDGTAVHVDQTAGMDIHVIGSGSGGTGSGLFLDLAYDLRAWAKELAGSVRVIGHLLLSDAFDGLIPEPVLPQAENNSHALLSEIDHFTYNGGWKVRYKGGEVTSEEPPFDLIYLLGRNGVDGGVRTRGEIVAMIGNVVATLATTSVGKHVMDSAVNLIPPILSRTDDLENRPCPYATYGISIGVADKEEISRKGLVHVARRIVEALLGRSESASREVERVAEGFLSETQLTFEELERLRREVPLFAPEGASPKDAELFRRGQHARKIEALAADGSRTVFDTVSQRFGAAMGPELLAKLKRVFTMPMDRSDGRKQDFGLRDLIELLRRLGVYAEDVVRWCEERLESLSHEGVVAARDIQRLAAVLPPPADWIKVYTGLVHTVDQKTVWTPFYTHLRETAMGQRGRLQELQEELDCLQDALEHLRERLAATATDGVEEYAVPYFRMASSERVLQDLLQDLFTPSSYFRQEVSAFIGEHETLPVLVEELTGRLWRIAERSVRDAVAPILTEGRIDVHKLLRRVDREYLKNKLQSMYILAQPAFRCEEEYPKEKTVTVGYCSGEHGGVVENVLGNMDGTLHTVADLRSDVTLMRFLYGVPLWAIQGAKRWEASAVSVQTSERATHNFLDPRWAEEILTLVPQSREHEEDLWLFTMFCRSGKIKKEGFTYHLYGTRLDGIRDRSAMFMEFRRLLSDGKISRTRAHREVEQFLITGRDDLAIVELLTDYLARMQRKLSKDAQGGVDRQEIKLLRDEIPVVKKFLGRKKSDLDLDGDVEEEEKDEVRESTPQDQLAWILTVFCCDGRIREEDGKYFLGDRLLEGVEGRKSLLDAFGRAFEEGALSRDEATRYVQDFLISGENLLSAVHRLSAHMGALETAVTSAAPEDAAVLNEELELLRAYIAKREASAGDGASGGKAGADFQDESF